MNPNDWSVGAQIYISCISVAGFIFMIAYFVQTWREEVAYWERIDERREKNKRSL